MIHKHLSIFLVRMLFEGSNKEKCVCFGMNASLTPDFNLCFYHPHPSNHIVNIIQTKIGDGGG